MFPTQVLWLALMLILYINSNEVHSNANNSSEFALLWLIIHVRS